MRDLIWIGSSYADLKRYPDQVMSGAGVLEIVEIFEGNAYRAVYTVRLKHAVYVLHCYQKKSHKGGKVPRLEQELIGSRLKDAVALDRSKDGQKD